MTFQDNRAQLEALMAQGGRNQAPTQPQYTANQAFARITKNLKEKALELATPEGTGTLALYLEFAGNYFLNAAAAVAEGGGAGDALTEKMVRHYLQGKALVDDIQEQFNISNEEMNRVGQFLRVQALCKQLLQEEAFDTVGAIAMWCLKQVMELFQDWIEKREEERGWLAIFGVGDYIPGWMLGKKKAGGAMWCLKQAHDILHDDFQDLLN